MAIWSTRAYLTAPRLTCVRWPRATGVPILAASLLIVGCGSRQPEITPATVGADRLLFERGTQALEDRDWIRAREYFTQIRDNYPQSALRAEARLSVADTFEGEGTPASYVMAAEEYANFLALFPTNERAHYAQYKLGMIYFQQMRRPERDQSETRDAISQFRLFEERHPTSRLLEKVRARLREAEDRLSESNFIVGHFYYRSKWYPGAIDRFETILREDPGYTGRYRVYFHLAHSYQESGQHDEAQAMFGRLLEEFPETEFVEDATRYMAELELIATTTSPEETDPESKDEPEPEGR